LYEYFNKLNLSNELGDSNFEISDINDNFEIPNTDNFEIPHNNDNFTTYAISAYHH